MLNDIMKSAQQYLTSLAYADKVSLVARRPPNILLHVHDFEVSRGSTTLQVNMLQVRQIILDEQVHGYRALINIADQMMHILLLQLLLQCRIVVLLDRLRLEDNGTFQRYV